MKTLRRLNFTSGKTESANSCHFFAWLSACIEPFCISSGISAKKMEGKREAHRQYRMPVRFRIKFTKDGRC